MRPEIVLDKERKKVDDDISIKIRGLASSEEVLIKAETKDDFGRRWSSYAMYSADTHGEIDLDKSIPKEGLYSEACSSGLLWSMELEENNEGNIPFFIKNTLNPQKIILELLTKGKTIATKELTLEFIDDSIRETVVNKEIAGKLYQNRNSEKQPAVIVLGGSTGGLLWSEQVAGVLSTKGYTTLALNYFDNNEDSLPHELSQIKVEYLEKALNWLKSKKNIDENNISILGISKGAEFSLVFGSMFPKELKSIVAYVPSAYIFEGITYGSHKGKSSWTYEEKELNFVEYPKDLPFTAKLQPGDIRKIHDIAIEKTTRKNLEEARIQVEKIEAPLMLISGRKDYTWDSQKAGNIIFDKLSECGNKYNSKHLCHEKMGHTFFLPNLPPIIDNPHISAKDAFYANREAWKEVVDFLSGK